MSYGTQLTYDGRSHTLRFLNAVIRCCFAEKMLVLWTPKSFERRQLRKDIDAQISASRGYEARSGRALGPSGKKWAARTGNVSIFEFWPHQPAGGLGDSQHAFVDRFLRLATLGDEHAMGIILRSRCEFQLNDGNKLGDNNIFHFAIAYEKTALLERIGDLRRALELRESRVRGGTRWSEHLKRLAELPNSVGWSPLSVLEARAAENHALKRRLEEVLGPAFYASALRSRSASLATQGGSASSSGPRSQSVIDSCHYSDQPRASLGSSQRGLT